MLPGVHDRCATDSQDCQAQAVTPAEKPAGESFYRLPVAKVHDLLCL